MSDDPPDSSFADYLRIIDSTHLDPYEGSLAFLGPESGLAKAFETANTPAEQTQLRDALDRLESEQLGNLYGNTDAHEAAESADRAHSLLRGFRSSLQVSSNHPNAKRAELTAVANAFERVWNRDAVPRPNQPGPAGGRPQIESFLGEFPGFLEFHHGATLATVGYWLAWDAMFRDNNDPSRSESKDCQIPILIDGSRYRNSSVLNEGVVGILQLERLEHGSVIYPDPWSFGFSLLELGPKSFWEGFQRAWALSGMDQGAQRVRWRLKPHRVAANGHVLAAQKFSGQSGEAAVLCGLFSLMGRIPGGREYADATLNEHVTVTATLGEKPDNGQIAKTKLGSVGGLIAKLDAAANAGLRKVVVSKRQQGLPEARAKASELELELVDVDTIGEAFEHLLRSTDSMLRFHGYARRWWEDRYHEQAAGSLDRGKARRGHQSDNGVESIVGRRPTRPFLVSQSMRLLTGVSDPLRHLSIAAVGDRRNGNGQARQADPEPDPWDCIQREELVRLLETYQPRQAGEIADDTVRPHDHFRRVVLTGEGGIGKSTNLRWLWWRLNERESSLAFHFELDRLSAGADEIEEALLAELMKADGVDDDLLPTTHALAQLRQMRDRGEITLLFDGLDQTLNSTTKIETLSELLVHPKWSKCRFVIGARPYAVRLCWSSVFQPQADEWRFLAPDKFAERDIHELLGESFDRIPPPVHAVLANPRTLDYVRQVGKADLEKLETASDIFYYAQWHSLKEGMSRSDVASRIGMNPGEPVPRTAKRRSIRRAMRLLAAIAFEMTSSAPDSFSRTNLPTSPVPNFEQIQRGPEFEEFCARVCRRLNMHASEADRRLFEFDLDGLAALNGPIQHRDDDQVAADVDGLSQIIWRDRSLQEFFTAFWMTRCSTEDDAAIFHDWPSSPYVPRSEEFHMVWRFATEMPPPGRTPESWTRAMTPLYQTVKPRVDGDNPEQGRGRCSELIHRSWKTLQTYRDAGFGPAADLLDNWLGEYPAILNSPLDSPLDSPRAQTAQSLNASFVAVPGAEVSLATNGSNAEPSTTTVEVQDLRMQATTVTRQQFALFLPEHDRHFEDEMHAFARDPDSPAIMVSWFDAICFARWVGARLPTEAEWQRACQHADLPKTVVCNSDAGTVATHPSSLKLEHMLGNVLEWCHPDDTRDGLAPLGGGCWCYRREDCNAKYRPWAGMAKRLKFAGFRLVRAAMISQSSEAR